MIIHYYDYLLKAMSNPLNNAIYLILVFCIGKVFSSIGEYEAHKSERVNNCTECQSVFTSACDLTRHNTHKCQNKFHCSRCFKTFASSNLLELHKQVIF